TESRIKLGEVARFDHDVKLAHIVRPEAQLASHHAPGFDPAIVSHMVEKRWQRPGESPFIGARLQIEPDVIDVHVRAPLFTRLMP
ncbi:MAG TPA: hypothetical protein DDY28_12060, partial [Hyphomonas atlantica]|nr:hypothetical protein [Hyphomonas atlantica]